MIVYWTAIISYQRTVTSSLSVSLVTSSMACRVCVGCLGHIAPGPAGRAVGRIAPGPAGRAVGHIAPGPAGRAVAV